MQLVVRELFTSRRLVFRRVQQAVQRIVLSILNCRHGIQTTISKMTPPSSTVAPLHG